MDTLIDVAARALAAGDPIGALKHVALRNDAPALALRGIAMAQLGEFSRARTLLRSAARAFGSRDAVSCARCAVAEAEVALAARDLGWPAKAIEDARIALQARGDRANAAYARLLQVRRALLIGRIDEAAKLNARADSTRLAPGSRTVRELLVAGIETRRLRISAARAALARVPALMAEVETALRSLNAPAARLISRGEQKPMLFDDVETLLASPTLVIDACRRVVRQAGVVIGLAKRPVLFAIVRALAEAWPGDISRELLVARVFRLKRADESLRARLRVEMGRLRRLLRPVAGVNATAEGFALALRSSDRAVVLALPTEEEDAAVLALLGDGESWSTSALAVALGTSQRSVQRSLEALASARKVQPIGRGRARRWTLRQSPGFTTSLLLPASLPID
jgi:tetratricopeptide (TPR) repeat protein